MRRRFYCETDNAFINQMKISLALKQRKIFFYNTVNENSVMETMYYLHRLMEIDEAFGEKRPIEILINSNGGSCTDGLSLIALIESMISSGYKIITTNMGRAFSMGFMLAISGSERRCYNHARYMIHDVSTGTFGKLQQIQEDADETKIIRNMMYDIVCDKTNITKEQLIDWQEHKVDKFFSAEEALNLKITDKLV